MIGPVALRACRRCDVNASVFRAVAQIDFIDCGLQRFPRKCAGLSQQFAQSNNDEVEPLDLLFEIVKLVLLAIRFGLGSLRCGLREIGGTSHRVQLRLLNQIPEEVHGGRFLFECCSEELLESGLTWSQ